MRVKSRLCALVGAASLAITCGCASDEFSSTHDYSKKPQAPIPTSPSGKASSPQAPPSQGKTDPDAPKEFTTTASGLKYRILRKTSGRKPTADNSVKVNYRGWLDNGKQFDSSYDRGAPISFPLRGVVAGWTEGIPYVSEGGMIELEIPGPLGYPNGQGEIPPNATLHFIVELLAIES